MEAIEKMNVPFLSQPLRLRWAEGNAVPVLEPCRRSAAPLCGIICPKRKKLHGLSKIRAVKWAWIESDQGDDFCLLSGIGSCSVAGRVKSTVIARPGTSCTVLTSAIVSPFCVHIA